MENGVERRKARQRETNGPESVPMLQAKDGVKNQKAKNFLSPLAGCVF